MTNREIRRAFIQREPVFDFGTRAGKITEIAMTDSGKVVSVEFMRDTGGWYNIRHENFARLCTQSQVESLFDKYGFGVEEDDNEKD